MIYSPFVGATRWPDVLEEERSETAKLVGTQESTARPDPGCWPWRQEERAHRRPFWRTWRLFGSLKRCRETFFKTEAIHILSMIFLLCSLLILTTSPRGRRQAGRSGSVGGGDSLSDVCSEWEATCHIPALSSKVSCRETGHFSCIWGRELGLLAKCSLWKVLVLPVQCFKKFLPSFQRSICLSIYLSISHLSVSLLFIYLSIIYPSIYSFIYSNTSAIFIMCPALFWDLYKY